MKVNTKVLMISSALFMCMLGLSASFLPHELLQAAGISPIGFAPIFVQIMGALYLGFAMNNWMSKGVTIGGIYARPLALGNFLHFAIGALTLIKGVLNNETLKLFWIAVVIYAIFAILFGLVLFTHPLNNNSKDTGK